jgi:UDP-N-acetylglucosamine--N-acetylmuramyl-(pentapeptide) pyrophosphoryl-undecaprenol N-acetylglucosamine transferase
MDEGSRGIVIAAGGTGGHLFPALTVADELRSRHPGRSVRFVGGRRGLEQRLVPQAGYDLWSLPVSGIKGRGLTSRLRAATGAGWSTLRCALWMARKRPALVIGGGGYASGPAVLAARLLGLRRMILEQNHFPGATNRWLAPRVDAVCVPSVAAAGRMGGRRFVTGNPVRKEFASISETPTAAEPTLLVFGGSRGARSINRGMVAALAELARLDPAPRIVHQTGTDLVDEVRRAYTDYPEGRAEVHAFLDDMPARIEAASLVVCRAGATSVAELAAAGRPAVLVPFPHAADDHQTHNARTLEEAGAAVMLRDDELDRLASTVAGLLADPDRLRRMGAAARTLGRLDAAERIADIADTLIDGRIPDAAQPEGEPHVP